MGENTGTRDARSPNAVGVSTGIGPSVYAVARYAVAFLIVTYGFAKLNGAQFTILQSELDKPMGEVDGFWLTWHYFGYSEFYGNLIALVQVAGGLLLVFRKTALLGACLLLPVVGNIVLIDVFYGVGGGALLAALLIGAGLCVVLAAHRRELFEVFWAGQNRAFPPRTSAGAVPVGKLAVCAVLVAVPALFTWWVANYNNRLPTPIDGAWEVAEFSAGPGAGAGLPSAVFFERNRAFMAVFKHGEGRDARYETHHFEVDPQTRSVTIWRTWLEKGPEIFDGRYRLSGERLRLEGEFAGRSDETTVVLEKRD